MVTTALRRDDSEKAKAKKEGAERYAEKVGKEGSKEIQVVDSWAGNNRSKNRLRPSRNWGGCYGGC
jgi:hypothetical protein